MSAGAMSPATALPRANAASPKPALLCCGGGYGTEPKRNDTGEHFYPCLMPGWVRKKKNLCFSFSIFLFKGRFQY